MMDSWTKTVVGLTDRTVTASSLDGHAFDLVTTAWGTHDVDCWTCGLLNLDAETETDALVEGLDHVGLDPKRPALGDYSAPRAFACRRAAQGGGLRAHLTVCAQSPTPHPHR